MFRPLSIFIGARYTRAKRRNHFVSFISLTSMIGLALGVLVMIVVLSVMNGFDREMRTRVLGMVRSELEYRPIDEIVADLPERMEQVQIAEQIEQRRSVLQHLVGLGVGAGQRGEIQCDRVVDTVVFAAIIYVLCRHGEPMA